METEITYKRKNTYPDSRSIIDTFRFYIMLSCIIYKDSLELKNKKIYEYKKELLDNDISIENINYFMHQACVTLPSDFNYIVGLESFNYKEKQYLRER